MALAVGGCYCRFDAAGAMTALSVVLASVLAVDLPTGDGPFDPRS